MTTTQPTAEQLRMARECAVSAVSTKLPGLMGNDFKGNSPKLRARIAKIRCAEGDHFVEVQSALLAIQATEARIAALEDALREIAGVKYVMDDDIAKMQAAARKALGKGSE